MSDIELSDKELEVLNTFKKSKTRTEKEIDDFLRVLISLREQPDGNPQTKKVEKT